MCSQIICHVGDGTECSRRHIRDVSVVGAGSASHIQWNAKDEALIGAASAVICITSRAATRTPTEVEMQTAVTVSVDAADSRRDAGTYYISIYKLRHRSDVSHWSDVVAIGRMSAATVVIGQMSAATVAIGWM